MVSYWKMIGRFTGDCQADKTDISRIKRSICARRFPKGDAPNGRRKRSESPLVGTMGRAPYLQMLRYLFLEMFDLSLSVPWISRYAVASRQRAAVQASKNLSGSRRGQLIQNTPVPFLHRHRKAHASVPDRRRARSAREPDGRRFRWLLQYSPSHVYPYRLPSACRR